MEDVVGEGRGRSPAPAATAPGPPPRDPEPTLLYNAPGVMPRCYMVKKVAPWVDAAAAAEPPAPGSPSEGSVAPTGYRPPDEHHANTESWCVDAAANYEELRSAPMCERSAAETEAAHELLSLAAGVPPLPPATVLTVLRAPDPVIPLYTYTLQPTTIYIVSEEQPEPMYHAVQTIPLQQIEYATIDNQHQLSFLAYPEAMPPPPPLEYHPLQHPQVACLGEGPPAAEQHGCLTTLTIEEITTDSDSDQLTIQVPVIEPPPLPQTPPQTPQQAPPSPDRQDDDSDEETLCIVTAKERQGKYDCSECGKRYATSSNLSRHKQTHRRLDSNSAKRCGECGKAYVSMQALAMHVLTHRMGHVCGVCGKHFSRPWLLRGHLRSHTGEKPYNCAACGKAFADRSNLRAHLQTHSDKKYECPRCKKSFALKSYLNKHQEAACTREDDEEDGAVA